MSAHESKYTVMVQSAVEWAKKLHWQTFESDLQLYTLDPGSQRSNHGLLIVDLMKMLTVGAPANTLVVHDRWEIGLSNNFLRARAISPAYSSFFMIDSPSTAELNNLFESHWNDLGFIYIVLDTLSLEFNAEKYAEQYKTDALGGTLDSNFRCILSTGHDNSYLLLTTRQNFTDSMPRLSELCSKHGRELDFRD